MLFCLGRKALNTNVVSIGINPRRGGDSLGGLLDFGVPAQGDAAWWMLNAGVLGIFKCWTISRSPSRDGVMMPNRSRAYGDLHGGARLALCTPVPSSATEVIVRRPESRHASRFRWRNIVEGYSK